MVPAPVPPQLDEFMRILASYHDREGILDEDDAYQTQILWWLESGSPPWDALLRTQLRNVLYDMIREELRHKGVHRNRPHFRTAYNRLDRQDIHTERLAYARLRVSEIEAYLKPEQIEMLRFSILDSESDRYWHQEYAERTSQTVYDLKKAMMRVRDVLRRRGLG